MGAIQGLWSGYSLVPKLLLGMSQSFHYLLAPVAVAQAGGGSSVVNLLCAKDQANENFKQRSGI